MPVRHISTVTQLGMTQRQPGTNVSSSTLHGAGFSVLHVGRYYGDMPNEYGGHGVSKRGDCDGLKFLTSDEAHDFAFRRGYLQVWYPRRHAVWAIKAAIKTAAKGYHGRRKLTHYLISVVNAQKLGDDVVIKYDLEWSELK